MEDVLEVYAQPYDAQYPVVCFDERPCFLIEDTIAPLPTQEGKIAKEHYSYKKNQSCALLAAIEPRAGKRITSAPKRNTPALCNTSARAIHLQRRSLWYRIT